jgi:ABC-type dipeptide/oligopeptide/nickel transport system permease subunit
LPGEREARAQTGLPTMADASIVAPATVEEQLLLEVEEAHVGSPARDAWRRFRGNWAAMVSLTIVVALVLMAAFAPFLHTTNPFTQNYSNLDLGPNPQHWFGTDGLGRDQFSRVVYGLRAPLLIGIVGAFITVLLGTALGLVAGFYGNALDSVLSRVTDLMFAFPSFTLAIIIMSFYGAALDPYFAGGGRLLILIVVFALTGWSGIMRFVRSLVLGMKKQQFIEAARVAGTSNGRILSRHFLPNIWGVLLIQSSFIVVGFIFTEAALSIFGLGIEPPNPDLGSMLIYGSQRLGINYWEAGFPSIFLTGMILAFTFLGDGIRDAVDPH